MKSLKKIMAGAMAVVMTATITSLGISASTYDSDPVEYATWETTYTYHPNTSTYTGTKDNCYMKYSPYGIEFTLLSMTVKYGNSNGSVTAVTTSADIKKVSAKLTRAGESTTIFVDPTNPIVGVNFEIYSDIDIVNNSISANGTMQSVRV